MSDSPKHQSSVASLVAAAAANEEVEGLKRYIATLRRENQKLRLQIRDLKAEIACIDDAVKTGSARAANRLSPGGEA